MTKYLFIIKDVPEMLFTPFRLIQNVQSRLLLFDDMKQVPIPAFFVEELALVSLGAFFSGKVVVVQTT